MADFDKISINGTYYNVKDTALTAAVNALTSEVGEVQETVTQQGQTIQQQGQQIQQQGQTIQQNKTETDKKIAQETEARETADTALSNRISALETAKNIKTVFDYGAKGDGVTDDTAAFTASLSEQGVCIVPKGTFAVTSIPVTGAQSIIGVGPGNSVLKAIKDGVSVIYGSGVDDAVFAHFAIDGANTCYNGFHFTESPTGLIDDCIASKCRNDGFHLEGITYTTAPLWRISNSFASENGACGFYIAISDTTIIGCTAVSNGQIANDAAGIDVHVSAKITNCHCWCRSDDAGLVRPNYSMRLDGPGIDVVNSHIEGAKVACLIIGTNASNVDIIGCLLYAPFGDYIAWVGQWNPNFTNCQFSQDGGPLKAFFGVTAENYNIVSCNFNRNVPLNDAGNMNNSYFLCSCSADYNTAFKNVNKPGCRGVARTAGGQWNDFPRA